METQKRGCSLGNRHGAASLFLLYDNKYFFTRNAQNDIVSIYRSSDSKLIGTYEYDLWGKPVSIKEATTGSDTDGILEKNPLRYRSYRYDAETGFYHLQSRYYDPNIRRFISADTVSAVTVEIISPNGDNLFAYCENSPVCFEDSNGQYVETPYDIVTLEMSLMEAAAPEGGFWEWVNVALDAADIAIPVATCPIGAGEICRFIRYACKSPAGELALASAGCVNKVGDATRHTYRHCDDVVVAASRAYSSGNKKLALGVNEYLDDFADMTNAHTWKNFQDTSNWQQGVLDAINDQEMQIVFNLDGIDNPWSAVNRAANGTGGATDWELLQIKLTPESWNRVTWYKNGEIVSNPFE